MVFLVQKKKPGGLLPQVPRGFIHRFRELKRYVTIFTAFQEKKSSWQSVRKAKKGCASRNFQEFPEKKSNILATWVVRIKKRGPANTRITGEYIFNLVFIQIVHPSGTVVHKQNFARSVAQIPYM